MSPFTVPVRKQKSVSTTSPLEHPGRCSLIMKPFRYVPAPKGMVFAAFWSENGYRLCPFNFGLGSGIVIEETKGVNERIIVSGNSIPNE